MTTKTDIRQEVSENKNQFRKDEYDTHTKFKKRKKLTKGRMRGNNMRNLNGMDRNASLPSWRTKPKFKTRSRSRSRSNSRLKLRSKSEEKKNDERRRRASEEGNPEKKIALKDVRNGYRRQSGDRYSRNQKRSRNESTYRRSCRLYFSNLSPEIDEPALGIFFKPFGSVEEILMEKTDSGNSGSVYFKSSGDAKRVKNELNGRIIQDCTIVLRTPDEERTRNERIGVGNQRIGMGNQRIDVGRRGGRNWSKNKWRGGRMSKSTRSPVQKVFRKHRNRGGIRDMKPRRDRGRYIEREREAEKEREMNRDRVRNRNTINRRYEK